MSVRVLPNSANFHSDIRVCPAHCLLNKKLSIFQKKHLMCPALEIVNLYLALLKGVSRLQGCRFVDSKYLHRISVHILDTHLNDQDHKWQASTSMTPVWQFLCHNLLPKKQSFWVFDDQHCSFISPLCLIEGPFWFDLLFFQFLCKFEASLSTVTVRHTPCHKMQRYRSSYWVTDKLVDHENSVLCLLCFLLLFC